MPKQRPVRVLITDRRALSREGLRRILADAPGFRVAGVAAEASPALAPAHCDVVLWGMASWRESLASTMKEFGARYAGMPVLVLADSADERLGLRILRAGAAGYINESSGLEEMLAALRAVAQKRRFVPDALAQHLAARLTAGAKPEAIETLTEREYEVMTMFAAGQNARDIARRLKLRSRTIATYKSRVLKKLGLRNSAEMAHFAITRGILR